MKNIKKSHIIIAIIALLAIISIPIIIQGLTAIMVADSIGDAVESVNNGNVGKPTEQEIQVFNTKFTAYESESQIGPNTKALFSIIISTNTEHPERSVTLKFNNKTYSSNDDIYEARKEIQTGSKYSISFNKNKDGFINEVVIKEI